MKVYFSRMILLLGLKNKIKDQISLRKAIKLFIEDGITNIELKLIGAGKKIGFLQAICKRQ